MSNQIPAVLVAQNDGMVISQNRTARKLLGNKTGQYCWDVVGGMEDAEGLPCQRGCVLQLLAAGMDNSRHTSFRYGGQLHQLSCVPVDGAVVCALTCDSAALPKAGKSLTPRERAVLELLATGKTTASVATSLGVSEATIRTHVENMRDKLGVNTRAAIVANGYRLGYLN